MKTLKISVVVSLLVLSLSPLLASRALASQPTVLASGQGIFFDEFVTLRLFSFHAQEIDGVASGNAVLARPGPGDNLHVDINCIRVVDSNTLVIGGTLQKATEFLPEGYQEVFEVRDGGEGNDQDSLSALFNGTCEDELPFFLMPIDDGTVNVQVP